MDDATKNRLRRALLENSLSLGGWLQIGHPACAEIFARLGFDWVAVDLEHGAIGIETMTDLFRALERFGSVPVARLPWNDPVWIKRSLDAGAQGLIVPMVNSAEEAERAVRQAKYPPRGCRGYGYSRASMHGIDFAPSIAGANRDVALIMQIEHRDGIARIDEILEVPDVDAVFIGPLDLSGSFGKTGELDCPEMVEALCRYREACRRHGKTAGMHLVHPGRQEVARAIAQGYRLLALGLDNVFLADGARAALEAARAQAAGV